MHIFVPVFGKTKHDLTTMITQVSHHTNAFELRADLCGDFMFQSPSLRSLFPKNAIVLFTYRPESNPQQIDPHITHEYELINTDIEDINHHNTYDPTKSVLAYHQFEPFDVTTIDTIISELTQYPAAYYKIALMLETPEDLKAFFEKTKALPHTQWILMGMGKMGKISRALFASLGFSTFACLPGQSVAPGQIEIDILNKILEDS